MQAGQSWAGYLRTLHAAQGWALSGDVHVTATEVADGEAMVARFDVLAGASPDPVTERSLKGSDFVTEKDVTLEFELPKLEFGVQLRIISLGAARLHCRRNIDLVEVSSPA